jgi:hypothetical protein
VAVEEHARAAVRLGKISLREAVEFFLRHNRADVPRLTLLEIAEQFAASRQQSGLSAHYVSQCRKTIGDLTASVGRRLRACGVWCRFPALEETQRAVASSGA